MCTLISSTNYKFSDYFMHHETNTLTLKKQTYFLRHSRLSRYCIYKFQWKGMINLDCAKHK